MAESTEADEAAAPDYPELLLRAGINFHIFLAATFGFGRERGHEPAQFVAWVAERLAGTWAGLRGHGADAVLRLVLENLAATGYRVEETSFGADESWALVGCVPFGLTSEEWQRVLAPFAATPGDMRQLFRTFMPLAASAGATLDVAETGPSLRLIVRRRAAAQPLPADLA